MKIYKLIFNKINDDNFITFDGKDIEKLLNHSFLCIAKPDKYIKKILYVEWVHKVLLGDYGYIDSGKVREFLESNHKDYCIFKSSENVSDIINERTKEE